MIWQTRIISYIQTHTYDTIYLVQYIQYHVYQKSDSGRKSNICLCIQMVWPLFKTMFIKRGACQPIAKRQGLCYTRSERAERTVMIKRCSTSMEIAGIDLGKHLRVKVSSSLEDYRFKPFRRFEQVLLCTDDANCAHFLNRTTASG